MTRARLIRDISVLLVLAATSIYAGVALDNPWIVLGMVSLLGFSLLVPNLASATIIRPARLLKSITWWEGSWFLMLMSGLVFRVRTAGQIGQSPLDAWALYRIGCMFAVAVILFFRLTFRKTMFLRPLMSGLIGLLFLFASISLLSTAWSINPPWTLYKSAEFLIDVVVVAGIAATLQSLEEYKRFVNWTWIVLGVLVLSAWVGAVLDPFDALFSDPHLRFTILPMRLVGVLPVISCNDLSEISAILALVSLCRLWTDPDAQAVKHRYRLLFVASMATLVITQTRGAFAAFLVGLIVLLIFVRRYRLLAVGGMLASGGGILLLLFTNFGTRVWEFLLRGEAAEKAGGLSGRLEIWQLSVQKFVEQPLIGYGGFAGARFVVLAKDSPWSDTLNVYIDAMLNTGLFGLLPLILLVGLIGWTLKKSVYRPSATQSERSLAMELSLAYTILVIRSMESGNLTTHPMLTFLMLVGLAEYFRRRNKFSAAQPEFIESNEIMVLP